jgi:hypothetical protein
MKTLLEKLICHPVLIKYLVSFPFHVNKMFNCTVPVPNTTQGPLVSPMTDSFCHQARLPPVSSQCAWNLDSWHSLIAKFSSVTGQKSCHNNHARYNSDFLNPHMRIETRMHLPSLISCAPSTVKDLTRISTQEFLPNFQFSLNDVVLQFFGIEDMNMNHVSVN